MKFQPRGGKPDANQAGIVDDLRKLGFTVDNVAQLKKLYDLVITGRVFETNEVRTLRVEIKNGAGELTPDEKIYWDKDGYHETLIIARSTEDVLRWFGHI